MYRRKRFLMRSVAALLTGILAFENLVPQAFAYELYSSLEISETIQSGDLLTEENIDETKLETDIHTLVAKDEILWDEDKEDMPLPKSYNGILQGYMPAVRSQSPYGNCWAHAGTACLEIGMLRNRLTDEKPEDFSLSIPHGLYYSHRIVGNPLGLTKDDEAYISRKDMDAIFNRGGSPGYIGNAVLSWMGPVMTRDFYDYSYLWNNHYTIEEGGELKSQEKAYGNRVATVTSIIDYEPGQEEEIKKGVLKYGAVSTGVYVGEGYNSEYAAHYTPQKYTTNHAVTIVGWDDEFPKEYFNTQPARDGAWLIRNSFGVSYGQNGYFWLSYEDKCMDGGIAFQVESVDKYDNNYYYDAPSHTFSYASADKTSRLESANVFTIQNEKELIKALNIPIFEPGYSYKIQLYKNPSEGNPSSGTPLLNTPIQGYKKHKGKYQIELEEPIRVEKNDKIAICVEIQSLLTTLGPIAETDRIGACAPGQSYYRIDGGTWFDSSSKNLGNFKMRMYTDTDTNGIGDNHEHDWSTAWEYDGDYHWHNCNGNGTCDAALHEDGRVYEKHYGGVGNCKTKPRCTGCGMEYGYILSYAHVGDDICKICNEKIDPKDRKSAVNPNYTFTTIEGREISSKADKKSKLIILFGGKCTISEATMKSLIQKRFSDLDIIAVEVNGHSKETVMAFKEKLGEGPGLENIQFCYAPVDGFTIREDYEAAYTSVYPDFEPTPLPLLCYIDKYNNFKYMTCNKQSLEEIEANLTSYLGYVENALNTPNPYNGKFISITDEKISAAAEEGRPKVIVFGITNFYMANDSLVNTLNSYIADFPPGVDIIYSDMYGSDYKDKVFELREYLNDGKEQIEFCTTEEYDIYSYYLNAAGKNGVFDSPIICYIDSNNYLQYVSFGESDRETLVNILKSTCDYEENQENPIPPLQEELLITKPSKTVYLTGETLDATGGKIILSDGDYIDLAQAQITGFDSSAPGIQILTVTYQKKSTTYNVIVLDVPKHLEGEAGDKLESILLPLETYGFFSWEDPSVILEEGTKIYETTFIPNDFGNYQIRDNIAISVTVKGNENPIEPEGDKVELAGYSLSLEGNIGVNFHMRLGEEVLSDAGAYMNFTIERKEAKEYIQVPVNKAIYDKEKDCYIFKCGVPVKDMDTEIKAQIILSGGNESSIYSYTVRKYIEVIKTDEEYKEQQKLLALVETMSNFGDYATAYFAGETIDAAPEVTEEELKDLANYNANIPENNFYYGSSLLLKSDTILRHYFTEEVKVAEAGYKVERKGDLYYIESEGIPAHELGIAKTVHVTTMADNKEITITYSPLSYAYIALSRGGDADNLISLMRAMYLYYQAALDYKDIDKK